jgi:GR25 family glycosyltransferase involved in LPS biosynthesis/predicted nucleic acid-binding Zn ribbon protein
MTTTTSDRWWTTAPIFVINLDRATDRWARWKQFSDIQRIRAVDMKNPSTSQNVMQRSKYVSLRTLYNITLSRVRCEHADINTAGAVGATLSHRKILLGLAEGNISSPAIVFEDDAALPRTAYQYDRLHDFLDTQWYPSSSATTTSTTTRKMNAYPEQDFDAMLLGHVKHRLSLYPSSNDREKQIGRRVRVFVGMHAVVYTRRFAQRILPWLLPVEGHIDAIVSRASELGLVIIRQHPTLRIRQADEYDSSISHSKPREHLIYEKQQQRNIVLVAFVIAMIIAIVVLRSMHLRYKDCQRACLVSSSSSSSSS